MKRYNSFCTEAQAKKACKLGAPIKRFNDYGYVETEMITAEQMVGWLEDQGIYVETKVNRRTDGIITFVYNVICSSYASLNNEVIFFDTRKEAALAAIDAALEYLEKLKQ